MSHTSPLQVHVLIDLEWRPQAGGQQLCWHNLAHAARDVEGLSLTIHAQGESEETRPLHANARLVLHRPVFSTRKLPFLRVPAHTDLARFHPGLARSLEEADVIHTTDAYFAYARTAETVSERMRLPMTHSIHTDTVSYSRIFARNSLERALGPVGRSLDGALDIAGRVEKNMSARLRRHENLCRFVLASCERDTDEAAGVIGHERVGIYRLGVDFAAFNPDKANRARFCARHSIPEGSVVLLFVGRLDDGKNVMRLARAVANANERRNVPFFLVVAGEGPKAAEIKSLLGARVSLAGFLATDELAEAYASSDWLAIPSMVETWSLVAGEALACGLPVIASAASGVGRFLSEEGAGVLVQHDDDGAWENALVDRCTFRGAERLSAPVLAAARTHFPSWQDALRSDFLPVWQRAAQQAGHPRRAIGEAAMAAGL